MPRFIPSSTQSSARQGLEIDVTARAESTLEHSIARQGSEFGARAYVGSEETVEAFPYRHFDVRPHTEYHVELRDAEGRLSKTATSCG